MLTSTEQLNKWLKEGREKGAAYCMIILDTWDWESKPEEFPRYIMPNEDVLEIVKGYKNPKGIEVLVKIYELENMTEVNFN